VGGWVVVEEWRQDDGAGGEGCVCEEGLIRQERGWNFWLRSWLNAGHNLCLVSCVFLSGPQALYTVLYL